MRTLRLSLVGTATFMLLGTLGAVGVSAQDTSQPFDGLILGSCHFPLDDACEAGVRTTCDGNGQTTFGRAFVHTEHCPQTSGPSSTDGGTGRFEGATGSIGFDGYGYFDGVDWPMVDWDWVVIPRGTVDVVAVPTDE